MLTKLVALAESCPVLGHAISSASTIGPQLQNSLHSPDKLRCNRARQVLESVLRLQSSHTGSPLAGWRAYLAMFDALDMHEVEEVRAAWQPHWQQLMQCCSSPQHVCELPQELLHLGKTHAHDRKLCVTPETQPQASEMSPAGMSAEGPQWTWVIVLFEKSARHENTAVQCFAAQALMVLCVTRGNMPCSSVSWLSTAVIRLLSSPLKTPHALKFVRKVRGSSVSPSAEGFWVFHLGYIESLTMLDSYHYQVHYTYV